VDALGGSQLRVKEPAAETPDPFDSGARGVHDGVGAERAQAAAEIVAHPRPAESAVGAPQQLDQLGVVCRLAPQTSRALQDLEHQSSVVDLGIVVEPRPAQPRLQQTR